LARFKILGAGVRIFSSGRRVGSAMKTRSLRRQRLKDRYRGYGCKEDGSRAEKGAFERGSFWCHLNLMD
jgi:hypothetical protein